MNKTGAPEFGVVVLPSGIKVEVENVDAAKSSIKKIESKNEFNETKELIDVSKKVVESIYEQIRQPLNLKEQFISYDAMPTELQRFIKAYQGLIEAKKELTDALQCICKVENVKM